MNKQLKRLLWVLCAACVIALGAVGYCQYAQTHRYVSARFEGYIVSYEETDEGLCIVIENEAGTETEQVRCLYKEGIMISDRAAFILDQRLIGAYMYASTETYWSADELRAEAYMYPLRSIGIQPVNWERLIEDGTVDMEAYEQFLQDWQPAVPVQ